jgi:hypothetical protein
VPRDFVDCDCYNLDKSLLNENVRFHRKTEYLVLLVDQRVITIEKGDESLVGT